ncbi:acyl-CoA dehydrogenase family protein [Pseudonocardia sp. CA-107938]|uniref:acyl-CoA dehydrogenase family protein n=1 Tax=Pseudonocardia sp. CA-107938 TaxID=3240021 RepID=UPI003D8B8F29
MDLSLTADEEHFRKRLEDWLAVVEIPEGLRDYGSTPTADDIDAGRAWQQLLVEAGWAALSWPAPHGVGATPSEQALFAEALARRGLPRQLSFVSMELAGPIIIAFGSPSQQAAHLEPIRRGAALWCQLFSEPGAGSDLAGLSTRADATGSGSWRVTGQKVWTSGAHYSHHGLLLARTDRAAGRHRGITCFALPMDRPGVTVRPIQQMDGESKFNEVFLDEVEVGEADVLGEVGGGWQVALSVLGRERRMLGAVAIGLGAGLTEIREVAEERGSADGVFRARWADLWGRVQMLRWTWFRLLSDDRGSATDPRMSVLKLTSSQLQQQVAALATDVLGPAFVTGRDGEAWRHRFLASHGATIAGGTSEIQRSILGERVLHLPR